MAKALVSDELWEVVEPLLSLNPPSRKEGVQGYPTDRH